MDRRQVISGLGALLSGAILPEDIAARENTDGSRSAGGEEIVSSTRKEVVLSDSWRFQVDIKNIGEEEGWFNEDFSRGDWRKVPVVPRAWDCYEDALWEYEGIAWYSTSINPADFDPAKKTVIIFNRVMYYTKVWLNGHYIGENIGGYLPFRFDITSYLKSDQPNTVVLRVDNKPRIEWLPAGKQIEWIQYGGILDKVEVVGTAFTYIEDVTIRTTRVDGVAQLDCLVMIANETNKASDVAVEVEVARGAGVTRKTSRLVCKPNQRSEIAVQIVVERPEVWSPETPVLYTAKTSLSSADNTFDSVTEFFGIRTVAVEGRSILLNGKPIQIRGVNRYDDYGRFGPNVPEDQLREELSLMKSAGINFIRMHYPQASHLLSLYDEYGFMMMEEIPMCWWGVDWFGETSQSLDILKFARPALEKMIGRDKNHPSIIFWSMANECQTDNETGIRVMRDLLDRARSLDPTRLVTFVVAGSPDGHLGYDRADIICINKYNGVFGEKSCNHFSDIDKLGYEPMMEELAAHRASTDKPIVITEFGTQGIRDIRGDVSYSEEFQAAYITRIWEGINSVPGITGGVLWCWADYFHRKYFVTYAAFGPYGVVTVDRKHKKSLEALARMYGGAAK